MHAQRMPLKLPVAFVVGILSLFLISACGNTSTGGSASATATAAACGVNQFRAATGTLQSMDSTSLQITDRQGKSVKATYDSNTRFTREAQVASTAIKSGTQITVVVKQNQDNTYTATRISLGTRQFANNGNNQGANNGQSANGSNNNQGGRNNQRNRTGCPTAQGQQQGQFGRGSGNGNNNNNNANAANNTKGISGTVGQINGNTLTVTDANSDDYTVSLAKTTSIIETQNISASDLHPGMTLSIVGKPDSKGTIAAQTVAIMLATNNSARN